MENKLYSNNKECLKCEEQSANGFKYIENKIGDKYKFENSDSYILIFILEGRILVSCNEFSNVEFKTGEMCLLPIMASCVWETLECTKCVVLYINDNYPICQKTIYNMDKERWLKATASFESLEIKPQLYSMLLSVKEYIKDGITCRILHESKQMELSMILREYYSFDELSSFFKPFLKNSKDFEKLIMKNYLNMKGVKEFVDLSGLNVSTFNRKFKKHFGMTPYQWMIRQKSKHIYHNLTISDKSISEIMREYDFSDASHFNRYCKSMFGLSPTELRKKNSISR